MPRYFTNSSPAAEPTPACPGCDRKWSALRRDGASPLDREWLEYRTCQHCGHTLCLPVSREDGIRACQIAIQGCIEHYPDRIPIVVPKLVTILGREALR